MTRFHPFDPAAVLPFPLRQDLKDTFIDSGVMSAIKEWISPLPDKSLPALRIREELLRILQEVSPDSESPLWFQGSVGDGLFPLAAAQRESGDAEAQRDRTGRHVSVQTPQRVPIQQRPRPQTHQ